MRLNDTIAAINDIISRPMLEKEYWDRPQTQNYKCRIYFERGPKRVRKPPFQRSSLCDQLGGLAANWDRHQHVRCGNESDVLTT